MWEFIGGVLQDIIDSLSEFTLLFGISAWNLILISIAATDLTFIIKFGIIGAKKEAGDD